MSDAGSGQQRSRGRPTLKSVAREAGVSVAAVSYVMSGQGRVSATTADRVRTVAERVGFRPNLVAQGLRAGSSRVFGLIVPSIVNPFYPEIAEGIVTAAALRGYHVFLCQVGPDARLIEREVGVLRDHQVDGLIFTAVTPGDRPMIEGLLSDGVPLVQAVRVVPGVPADSVTTDNVRASYDITEHLLQLGHLDFAVIAGPRDSSACSARLDGVHLALAERGLTVPRDCVRFAELSRESGYQAASELLGTRRHFTALVCGNDMIAMGAADVLLERGLRIPEDVAVVGFDDMSFASLRMVSLTTVHQPLSQFGSESVDLLLSRIADPELPPRSIVLAYQVVLRRSSGEPRPELVKSVSKTEGSEYVA